MAIADYGNCPICDEPMSGSSHYHCPNCGGRCSMMGHWDMGKNDYSCQAKPNRVNEVFGEDDAHPAPEDKR